MEVTHAYRHGRYDLGQPQAATTFGLELIRQRFEVEHVHCYGPHASISARLASLSWRR
jgi:hypothetical protein